MENLITTRCLILPEQAEKVIAFAAAEGWLLVENGHSVALTDAAWLHRQHSQHRERPLEALAESSDPGRLAALCIQSPDQPITDWASKLVEG
jgi:hypothetical protein